MSDKMTLDELRAKILMLRYDSHPWFGLLIEVAQLIDINCAALEASLFLAPTSDVDAYWWCPNCKEELSGSRVTYQEKCDTCGYSVSLIEPHHTYNTPTGNMGESLDKFISQSRSYIPRELVSSFDAHANRIRISFVSLAQPTGDVGDALDKAVRRIESMQTEANLAADHFAYDCFRSCLEAIEDSQLRTSIAALQRSESEAVGLIDELITSENIHDSEVKMMILGGGKFDEERTEYHCWWCETEYQEEQCLCTNPACPAVRARAITTKEGDE